MSKYGVFSGPYFSAFGLNMGIYGPWKTPYLDTFHPVIRGHVRDFFLLLVVNLLPLVDLLVHLLKPKSLKFSNRDSHTAQM